MTRPYPSSGAPAGNGDPGEDGDRVVLDRPEELSSLFAPFLRLFLEENERTGGTVTLARGPMGIDGFFLRRASEKVGSIFARSRAVAERLYADRGGLSVYSEFRLDADASPFPVYSADLATWRPPPHRFAHTVRTARSADVPQILRVMREVYGAVDEAWVRAFPLPGETAFIAEVDGRPCGVAWLAAANGFGRLHSLSVVPRYRHLGVGTDLWHARMLYARGLGVGQVLTEIAETNTASRAISTAGGLRRIGQVFDNRG